jgi:hypothetical protein
MQSSNILVLTVSLKLINFVFKVLPHFDPEMSASFTSYVGQVLSINLAWIPWPLQWRKLHSEKLIDLYCSSNVIRMIKSKRGWAGYVARVGEINEYRVLVGNPEGKRPR